MTQLIENDTDTEKPGRAPSSTFTCCLLIAARRQVKGFPPGMACNSGELWRTSVLTGFRIHGIAGRRGDEVRGLSH